MSALDTQVGGDHYKSATIQPVQYIEANGLKFLEGCCLKRITRHDKPTGKGRQDIEKAIHELQLLLELRYPVVDDLDPGSVCPPTRPAWPDNKAYRWMAQDADGRWYSYSGRPVAEAGCWICTSKTYCNHGGRTKVIGDWRDTLIERGADE